MTATAIEPKDAVSLAQTLADLFRPGLPVPGYITLHPAYVGSETISAVHFQFHGPGSLDAVAAWADWADLSVEVHPDYQNPSVEWHSVDFTYSGVLFHAYTLTATDA
jgi:hypothetical protein